MSKLESRGISSTHCNAKSILSANEKMEHPSHSSLFIGKSPQKSIIKPPSKDSKKKHNYLDAFSCECGPDLYNKVFGPTADEAILGGIQTIMKLFHKLMVCDEEEEKIDIKKSVLPGNIAQESNKNVKSVGKMVSEILESIGLPPEMATEIVQKSLNALEVEKPSLAEKLLQPSSLEMVSQILQTIGFSVEFADQMVQTSLESVREVQQNPQESPSMYSKWLQTSAPELKSGMMQTSLLSNKASTLKQASESLNSSKINIKQESSAAVTKLNEKDLNVIKEESIAKLPTKNMKKSGEYEGRDLPPESPQKVAKVCFCCPPSDEIYEPKFLQKPSPRKLNKCTCCQCPPPCPDEDEIYQPELSQKPPKKSDKCTCCQCPPPCPDRDEIHESEPPQEPPNISDQYSYCKCLDKNIEEKYEPHEPPKKSKKCTCCKCAKDTVSFRSRPVSERIREAEVMICNESHELKICKCYECSAPVPLLYRKNRNRREAIYSKPKLKCKCGKRPKNDSGSYLSFERGDDAGTCTDQKCCDNYKIYRF